MNSLFMKLYLAWRDFCSFDTDEEYYFNKTEIS